MEMQEFFESQTAMFRSLIEQMQRMNTGATAAAAGGSSPGFVPLPPPLSVEGDMERNFDFFMSNWQNYAKSIGVDRWPQQDEERKVSLLMSVIGEAALKKYSNFELTQEERHNLELAVAAIKAKVVVERNKNIDRLDFFEAQQHPLECTEDFLLRLKHLSRLAKLGDLRDELVVFKLATSNKWPHLRQKMLTKPDITEADAVAMCRNQELGEARSQQAEVNKLKKSAKLMKCKFCGDRHEFKKGACPAIGKKCTACGGKNHYERVCKSEGKIHKKKRRVNVLEEEPNSDYYAESSTESEKETENSEDEAEIRKIYDNSASGGQVLADLEVNVTGYWKTIKCELDTGANTSIIGKNWLNKIVGSTETKITPSNLRLFSFGGNPIPVLGETKISCRRNGKRYKLVFQVVEVDHIPLLSANASKTLGYVKFCNSVSFATATDSTSLLNIHRLEAMKIVDQYKSVFEGYGRFAGEVSLEVDQSVQPCIQPPRRIPLAFRGPLKEELDKLERDGIVIKEFAHTEWVSNVVLVKREKDKTSSIRICLDPVHLNQALKRPNLQFPTIDEILPELGRAKIFTMVDARKGFWHVVLDEKSSRLTTFWTPFGRCGESMEQALVDHNRNLRNLLERLEKSDVKLNREKLKVCERSVKFYGHILSDSGLRPDDSKVSTIKNYPVPTNKKELHRFVGLVTYLGRFLPNLSANITMLRRLISEKEEWNWSSAHEEEFNRLKFMVSDVKTLCYYDQSQPLVIECDASCYGLGVAVFQRNGVVGYASRTLTTTEKNYAQIEKELLAILFACVRFDQLVVGNRKVTVKTDHKPLVNVFRKPLISAPRRLQRMLLNLQRYQLNIEYATGKDNVVADALSRAPLPVSLEEDDNKKFTVYQVFSELHNLQLASFFKVSEDCLNEVVEETKKDSTMQQIISYIHCGWPAAVTSLPEGVKVYFKYKHELATQEGLVYRNDRILVPYALRKRMVSKAHVSHNGVEATLKLARANLFWPGMSAQIRDSVAACSICAKFASSQVAPPMQTHPFQLISLDVFFADYQGQKRKFLVTVDHYSDFFEVNLLKDLTPGSTITACKSNFARHGRPQVVLSDNGTNFYSREWGAFTKEWDFKHTTSAPNHQQANGKAEAAVKIAKHLLKKAESSGTDFWYALLHWRNIPNKIGSSPVQRLFSRNTKCGLPTSASKLTPKVVENVAEAIETNRKKAKQQYDKKTRELPDLEVGSPVYVQLNPESSKHWTPAVIHQRQNERSFVVDVQGSSYRRDRKHLKPRKEPITPSSVQNHPSLPTTFTNEQVLVPDHTSSVSLNDQAADTATPEKNDNTMGTRIINYNI
ncbi:uncharacterized protein K02A2.6-like [Uranotaenia lowii]|uniref:uncharacterized protein K02A2.6-like n=1 Tax=Uranotaenia lowii TaxID=190385 RepID=UPI002479F80F|nr:uncharacterized protein K02A2.6-like [Uranotaenia lowii]